MSINGLEKLMIKFKNGDKSVFDKIYELTSKPVYFAAYRILADRGKAEDIMQDVYINLVQKIQLYNDGNALGFLVTMSKRLALNELKRGNRETPTDYAEDIYASPEAPLENCISPLVELARKVLKEDEYDILMLAEISGYKRKEIALILKIPISTVTYKYLAAIDKLKQNYLKEVRREN